MKEKFNIKQTLLFLSVIAVLCGISGVLIKSHLSQSKRAVSASVPDSTYPKADIQTLVYDHTKGGYSASRPVFHIKKIDNVLNTYVHQELKAYQKRWNAAGKKTESELNLSYSILHFSRKTVSVAFEKYEHTKNSRKTDYRVFTFDLDSGVQLQLDDLFDKNSNYLSLLSDIAYEELESNSEKLPKKRKKELAAPVSNNFNSFSVLKNSLVFYLSPKHNPNSGNVHTIAVKKDIFSNILLPIYQDEQLNRDLVKEKQPKHIVTTLPGSTVWVDPAKKVIALTFDDGPHPVYTAQIVKELKKHQARATFFVLGSRAQQYPETIRKIHEEGSEVASHSWDHPQLTRLAPKKIKTQISKTQKAVIQACGTAPVHLRPPYGAVNDKVRKNIGQMNITLWNIDPEDWKQHNAMKVTGSIMSHAEDGKIILMHDIYASSANAAGKVIKELQDEGFQLVTVSELEKVQRDRKLYKIGLPST